MMDVMPRLTPEELRDHAELEAARLKSKRSRYTRPRSREAQQAYKRKQLSDLARRGIGRGQNLLIGQLLLEYEDGARVAAERLGLGRRVDAALKRLGLPDPQLELPVPQLDLL